ncbi:neprilysin-2-like [Dermacentor albipictus]|uniref:neprilysin-2-like n=1 Tax=Dermacentor albipictus TaxID=60249 RepID=UPI0038FBE74D
MSKTPLSEKSGAGCSKRKRPCSSKEQSEGTTPSSTSTAQADEATLGPMAVSSETTSCRDSTAPGSRRDRRRSRAGSVVSLSSVAAAKYDAKRRASQDSRGRDDSGSETHSRRRQPSRKPSLTVSSSGRASRRASKAEAKGVTEVDAPVEDNLGTATTSQVSSSVTPASEAASQATDSEASLAPRLVKFAVIGDSPRPQVGAAKKIQEPRTSSTTDTGSHVETKRTATPSASSDSVSSSATRSVTPETQRASPAGLRDWNASKSSTGLSGDSAEFSVDNNRSHSQPPCASSAISSAPETTRSGPCEDSSRLSPSFRGSGKPPVTKRNRKAVFDFTNILSPPKRPLQSFNKGKRNCCAVVTIGAAAFAALLLTVAMLIYSFVASDSAEKPVPLCSTEDCIVHADILTASLNRSLDPCDDFRAFVCSAWSPRRQYRERVTSVMDEVIFAHLEALSAVLRYGSTLVPAGEKARRMHELCERYFEEGDANINGLHHFMKNIGLSWPEEPEDYHEPSFFDVLMELSLKWQMPFWISVSVLQGRDSTRGRLLIKPGEHIAIARNRHRRVIMDGDYGKYLQGFYITVSEDDKGHAETFFIEQTKAVEGDVLEQLYNCIVSKIKDPASFPLSDIGNFTTNIPSVDWKGALQKHLSFDPSLAPHDRVLVSDTKLLETIDRLLGKYDNRQLLRHLAWLFVQTYAPVFDSGLLWFTYGGKSRASPYRPVFCGLHVEAVFKLLVLCLTTVSRLTGSDEKFIDGAYGSLVSTAVRMVNASKWLDDESKALAVRKLSSLRVRVWPPPHYTDNDRLEKYYKEYPLGSETFREYWLAAHLSMYQRTKAKEMADADSLPMNYAPAHVSYDYTLNSMALPIGIVDRPFYYPKGTDAMFYGGLGFLLAKEMVKALDNMGLRWHPNGNHVDSIFSKASTSEFRFKDGCLRSQGSASIFPEVPALEIAHSSLLVALKESGPKLIRKDLPDMVVFFMTLCYVTCATEGFPNPFAADCNKAVRNSAAFASAFHCTVGSKMNPGSKCDFFD